MEAFLDRAIAFLNRLNKAADKVMGWLFVAVVVIGGLNICVFMAGVALSIAEHFR